MRNLIITTSSKGILETRNSFEILQNREYLDKTGDREVKAGVCLGGMEEMKHICQLWTITSADFLAKFAEPNFCEITEYFSQKIHDTF